MNRLREGWAQLRGVSGRVGGASASLRWRVTALVVLVVAVALVVIGVAVDLSLSAQLRRDQQSRLDDRAARASLLITAGTTGPDLAAAAGGQGIRALLVDAAGRRVGVGPADDPGDRPGPPGGGPPVAGSPRAGPPLDRGGPGGTADRPFRNDRTLTRSMAVPDGTRLILAADPDENDGVLRRLRAVMVVVGAGGLVLIAFALLGGVRVALRPLETMTGLARDIAGGDRGRRLHPARTDTELGATAQAFDAMLDALETAQARAETAADEARRSEATTRRFLSDAAHELRTPISGVQSLAETLVRHPDTELERRERIATTLVRETRRAGALVADMLELARIEGGMPLERRTVDLAALAAAEGDRLALLAPSLTVPTTGGPVPVEADPARVGQILANLLENARRHSPDGGTVRLEVGLRDGWAQVDVVDEGPGVAPADRERIFDRLVRLDDARTRDAGGAGLGLPIARALARAHGGDLSYVDHPGEAGARFRLALPAEVAAHTASSTSVAKL